MTAIGRRLAALCAGFALAWSSASLAWGSEVTLGESGGIYTAPVQINRSVTLQFLVDPGAAVVVIPRSVLTTLVRNGSVSRDDVLGVSVAELADRSLYEAVQLRLRELRVGDNVARDVVAAVSPSLTHPLLGQTFLKRFASVTFDNQRHVLILSNSAYGSGYTAGQQYPATPPSWPYYPSAPAAPASPYNPYGYPSYPPQTR